MKPDVNEILRHKMNTLDATETDPDFDPEPFWDQLERQLPPPVRIPIWRSKWYWAHAAAFLIGGALLAFWLRTTGPQPESIPVASTGPVITEPASAPSRSEPVVLPASQPEPLPPVIPAKRPVSTAIATVADVPLIPESKVSEPVRVVPDPSPIPEVPSGNREAPRAVYLTDAAPQTLSLVAETPQQPLSKKRPFFLSSEPFQTQTALQRPASVLKGLRP